MHTSDQDALTRMLKLQTQLQIEAYGADYSTFTPEQRMESFRQNFLSCVAELMEAMDETGWKPWASSNHINKEAFKKEMVDAWHFFMNCMLLGDMTAEDLAQGYMTKREINLQRQRDGYDGLNKCPACKRAYDDSSTRCKPAIHTVDRDSSGWCAVYGWVDESGVQMVVE